MLWVKQPKKQWSKIGHIHKVIEDKLYIHPSHFYNSWMVFLIPSMATTINLNTSLNQHSKLKFVFYLYVKVLLGNIPYPKVCLLLAYLWFYALVEWYFYFWIPNEINFPKKLGTFITTYFSALAARELRYTAKSFQSAFIIKVQSSQVPHYITEIYENRKLPKLPFVIVSCNTNLIMCHTS